MPLFKVFEFLDVSRKKDRLKDWHHMRYEIKNEIDDKRYRDNTLHIAVLLDINGFCKTTDFSPELFSIWDDLKHGETNTVKGAVTYTPSGLTRYTLEGNEKVEQEMLPTDFYYSTALKSLIGDVVNPTGISYNKLNQEVAVNNQAMDEMYSYLMQNNNYNHNISIEHVPVKHYLESLGRSKIAVNIDPRLVYNIMAVEAYPMYLGIAKHTIVINNGTKKPLVVHRRNKDVNHDDLMRFLRQVFGLKDTSSAIYMTRSLV